MASTSSPTVIVMIFAAVEAGKGVIRIIDNSAGNRGLCQQQDASPNQRTSLGIGCCFGSGQKPKAVASNWDPEWISETSASLGRGLRI